MHLDQETVLARSLLGETYQAAARYPAGCAAGTV
jgi:hypothetical protein